MLAYFIEKYLADQGTIRDAPLNVLKFVKSNLKDERVVAYFNCAVKRNILLQGYLFVTE